LRLSAKGAHAVNSISPEITVSEHPLTPEPGQYIKICQARRILDALKALGDEGPKCDFDNALIGKLRALPEIRAALKFAARIETAISDEPARGFGVRLQ
jgi:hypothetical protein